MLMQISAGLWVRAAVLLTVVGSTLSAQAKRSSDFLYVWTASQDTTQPDFLAVFDVWPASPRYGTLVTTVPVPGRNNRPHHTEHEMPADAPSLRCGVPVFCSGLSDFPRCRRERLLTASSSNVA